MPKRDEPYIDTGPLGLATELFTPGRARPEDHGRLYKVVFDTGIVMYVPTAIFLQMKLHLQER